MQRVRFGVIGLGRFGEVHCEALSGMPEVELVALATRTPERLAAMGARFEVRRLYADYREMLADAGVDAVSVVTMWDQHASPVIAALEAGKHVFVEKPMASTVEDCAAMIEAAARTGRRAQVGHICRFNPRYAAAKRAIDAGELGKIVSIHARRNIPASVSRTVVEKIGPVVGDGVHDTDLMLWYTGSRIVSAYAQTHSERGLKYPDLGWTMYRFASGAIGVCENVWFLPEGTPYRIDERMEIIGTKGAIYVQDNPASLVVSGGGAWRAEDTTYWPKIGEHRGGALREELTDFVRSLGGAGCGPAATLEDSARAVAACLAAEESARCGQPVEVRGGL